MAIHVFSVTDSEKLNRFFESKQISTVFGVSEIKNLLT